MASAVAALCEAGEVAVLARASANLGEAGGLNPVRGAVQMPTRKTGPGRTGAKAEGRGLVCVVSESSGLHRRLRQALEALWVAVFWA